MKTDIDVIEQTHRLLNIDMTYLSGRNNNETGKIRRESTIKICARFNLIDPVIASWLYDIPHRLALEHLNKLVNKEKLLICIQTIRAPMCRVYVLSSQGAQYAEELLHLPIPFRKTAEPSRQINQNNIMHDLINAFCCLRGLHNYDAKGIHKPFWDGMLSEIEFRRLHKFNSQTRVVDGLLREVDGTIVGCEIEHSFKSKATRQSIILKHLNSLQQQHYHKVFFFSQSKDILNDAKRFNGQLIEELSVAYNKKTGRPFIFKDDVELLKRSLVYRTKFCDEIQSLFYP